MMAKVNLMAFIMFGKKRYMVVKTITKDGTCFLRLTYIETIILICQLLSKIEDLKVQSLYK